LVDGLRQTYHSLGNHFGRTWWNCYVMWVLWNLISVCLDIVLLLSQDRCTVCTKSTIGSKIILDAPNGTPRWLGSCGFTFRSVWIHC
jgi:hypothetical protein